MTEMQRALYGRLPQLPFPMRMLWLQVLAAGLALLALSLVLQHGVQASQRWLDDTRYGYPRSVSVTGYVGHGDERSHPTVVQTLNMDGQISILVFPGGDVDQLTVLDGPYIVGSDGAYAVAYPALRDINADGHVDLVVTVRDEAIVYINEDGAFRMLTSEERAELAESWYRDE